MIRRVLKLAIAILILCAISGCKETPTRHQNKKNQAPQYDIEKVSKNIERFTATDNPEPVAEPIVEPPHLILDLPASLKDLPSNDMGPQIERSTISQFPSDLFQINVNRTVCTVNRNGFPGETVNAVVVGIDHYVKTSDLIGSDTRLNDWNPVNYLRFVR